MFNHSLYIYINNFKLCLQSESGYSTWSLYFITMELGFIYKWPSIKCTSNFKQPVSHFTHLHEACYYVIERKNCIIIWQKSQKLPSCPFMCQVLCSSFSFGSMGFQNKHQLIMLDVIFISFWVSSPRGVCPDKHSGPLTNIIGDLCSTCWCSGHMNALQVLYNKMK